MKKILIVDDSFAIRMLLTTIISRKGGFEIAEASTARVARSLCAANRYDLIFLDHMLPDGIGWEIAEMIYCDPQKYGNPMIIAMSGSVPQKTALKSGIHYSQFMHKPFNIARIEEILEKLPEDGPVDKDGHSSL